MGITVELSEQEIASLKQLTKNDSDADAIRIAALEYLRLIRLRELKQAAGKVELVANWAELENRELMESPFPS